MTTVDLSRRGFLKASALVGGGLAIGLLSPDGLSAALAQGADKPLPPPDFFVRVGADDIVTVIVNKTEMGQGVYTGIAMLVAEELEADWSKIRVETAPVNEIYRSARNGMQLTSGSSSMASSWDVYRPAGAALRTMLIAAAAAEWNIPAAECRAENNTVLHSPTGRRLSYGHLAAAAEKMPIPTSVTLKEPSAFKLIGQSLPRLDSAEKSTGRAIFGMDMDLPDLRIAVVAHPPVLGATIRSIDDSKAKAVRGVRLVAPTPYGVAIVADSFWQAVKGRDALVIDWNLGPNAALSTDTLLSHYAEMAKAPGNVARKDGDPAAALAKAARRLDVEYDVPYLAHAPMEPLNCTVDLRPDHCEIWVGTQFQSGDHKAAMKATGLKPEQVTIHTLYAGGSFGRRVNAHADFVLTAIEVAKVAKAPVKVVWTREDDMRGWYYRPMAYDRISVGLDGDGRVAAWQQTIVSQSIAAGTEFEPQVHRNGLDMSAVAGAANMPYAIPNIQVDLHTPTHDVPVLWWRSVGSSHTGFVVESVIDELAHAAGRDPVDFRAEMLAKSPRHVAVLKLAAEKAGWGKPLPAGVAQGVAVFVTFGTYVAHVVEVSSDKGKIKVQRVVTAVDCGLPINPRTIQAQMESAAVFTLSAALYGEITIKDGAVQQSNFHDYQVLRMDECPKIEVHIVPSTERPTGVGEPAVPPLFAAVANAVFAATGTRVRSLPLAKAGMV
ncbi:xanthine dehydrogenase family protein molybdopterin-binding subunit [Azospirillum rugosum]|uniref:Isoquinoline 1-oxidoreductase beta subunit n=1 Tax=Azospirillum rugosum TaxID=416170 RepID=A0ABS4SRA4_9PROT|nr:xanthine dehydrogenase family protein molybdopterin-binding subunit [Azospirillum rugosum]MBP2294972.1 isoquinoline 1-oxidoreductase beta subunit [Azospirillum rugosum]MDQ0530978.1 isoquinoline 1-oxidoreductase beta subunit [Azospirillum rugosum]